MFVLFFYSEQITMENLPPSVRRRLENDEVLKAIGKRRGDQQYNEAMQNKEMARLGKLNHDLGDRIDEKWGVVDQIWEQREQSDKNTFKMNSPRFEELSKKAFEIIKQNNIKFNESKKKSISTTEQAYATTRSHMIKLADDIKQNDLSVAEKAREDKLLSSLYLEDTELSELVAQYHTTLNRIVRNNKLRGEDCDQNSSTPSVT